MRIPSPTRRWQDEEQKKKKVPLSQTEPLVCSLGDVTLHRTRRRFFFSFSPYPVEAGWLSSQPSAPVRRHAVDSPACLLQQDLLPFVDGMNEPDREPFVTRAVVAHRFECVERHHLTMQPDSRGSMQKADMVWRPALLSQGTNDLPGRDWDSIRRDTIGRTWRFLLLLTGRSWQRDGHDRVPRFVYHHHHHYAVRRFRAAAVVQSTCLGIFALYPNSLPSHARSLRRSPCVSNVVCVAHSTAQAQGPPASSSTSSGSSPPKPAAPCASSSPALPPVPWPPRASPP